MGKKATFSFHLAPRILLSEADQDERQRIYLARLQDVTTTCANFKNFQAQFKEMETRRAEKEGWEQYIRCDDLPNPKSPVEVRTFLSKLRHFEDLEVTKCINWTLSVDERSVLTQNIFQKDLTRKVVEKAMYISPALYFEVNVGNCLEVLRQIDVLMVNEVAIDEIALSTQNDILNVYGELQQEIQKLFDRLTYRVLATQNATMKSVDGIVATWSHSSDQWGLDLWGFLNVPIIFKQKEASEMIAQLPATGVQVQMPLSILTDCMTLRCVHTSFDHYSKDAKSFEHPAIDHNDGTSAGILDMVQSVMTEWLIQMAVQDEILMIMQRKREDYLELMQLIAERTEKASKKFGDSEHIVIPKTPKEVQAVPPGMVPEIFDDFISREKTHYDEYMENYFHPKLLDMLPHEVNLREYHIVGGIYSLMFVELPGQTDFQSFNVVLHHDRRVLRLTPDTVAERLKSREPLITESNRSSQSSKKPSSFNASISLDKNELPYYIVTVKLPPDLCKWGKPRVCHYLTESQRPSTVVITPLRPSLFDSRPLSKELSSENIMHTSISSLGHRSTIFQSKYSQSIEAPTDVMDFSLDGVLDKVEVISLATHCVPRIISSFKFPVEFNVEEAAESTPKMKRTYLTKRGETYDEKEVALPEDNFDYNMQEDPERLFPRFSNILPVKFTSVDNEACNKRSACGVITAFNTIKRQYEKRPQAILQLEEQVTSRKDRSDVSERLEFTADSFIGQETASKKSSLHKPSLVRRSKRMSSALHTTQNEVTPVMVTHWTTKYIIDETIDSTTDTLTFRTDRLGIFGLAFKRYEHFPFREWCLQPSEDNPEEVVLSLSTHHVSMFFYISSQGVRGYVTDLIKGYASNPVKYVEIKEPISDFRQLEQTLVDKNFNIFPATDASFYITNDYFCVKHLATEMHTYSTMALHCRSMKFYRSSWNRLADRRNLIMDMKLARDTSEYTEVTMRITPEKTTFVKVSELCSDKMNDVKLHYENTWRNVNNYVDLNAAILAMNSTAQEPSNKTAQLFIYITKLLGAIRPLSFA
ncbi:hypothetical protein KR054_011879 [Drosophila jambulina]|nr:hypothetical protein KR054_011879 [Drosophila jambulina]